MSMASMEGRNVNGVDVKNERRTRRTLLFLKTGMISMILRDRIVTRNTRIVMRRSERLENGKIDYMPTEWLEGVVAIWRVKRGDHR